MRKQNYVLTAFIVLLLVTLFVRIYRDGREEEELLSRYERAMNHEQAVSGRKPALENRMSLAGHGAGVPADGCLGLHYTAQVNGVPIYYERAGQGKPIILLHENGGSHLSFATMIRQLAAGGYEVFAIDSRGQGVNPPLPEYHYSDMAEDVYNLILEWNLNSPFVYGWSDGGITGLLLCLNHPGCVRALAVSGINLYPEGLDSSFLTPLKLSNALLNDPLTQMILDEPMIDPENLSRLRIPVLLTAGENDIVRPEHTWMIASSIPDCRLKIVEGESHSSYIVDSQIMGSLLIDFLDDL